MLQYVYTLVHCPAGQLEVEEFVLILTTKLGVGGGPRESAWQQLPDGSWSMEVEQGSCFGEAALLNGLVRPLWVWHTRRCDSTDSVML
jgi:hypothetical protein